VAEDNDGNSELKIRTENIPGMNADLMKSVIIRFLYFSVSRCELLLELLLLCPWQCHYYSGNDLFLPQERLLECHYGIQEYMGVCVADTHLALGLSILCVCYVCVKSYF